MKERIESEGKDRKGRKGHKVNERIESEGKDIK